jgi:hypothetical protein
MMMRWRGAMVLACSLVGMMCALTVLAQSTRERAAADVEGPDHAAPMKRTTAQEGLLALVDGIRRGDANGVVESIAFGPGVEMSASDRRVYGESFIASSKLRWVVEEKFGTAAGRLLAMRADLPSVAKIEPDTAQWEENESTALEALGVKRIAFERVGDSKIAALAMVRMTDGGWRLHKVMENVSALFIQVQDGPWRIQKIHQAMQDLEAGRLKSAQQVGDALIPHVPTSRPAVRGGDRSTPDGAVAALRTAIEREHMTAVADGFMQGNEAKNTEFAKALAEDLVTARLLTQAVQRRFSAEQAHHILENAGVRFIWLETYWKAAWEVDGNVARGAFEPAERYRWDIRMTRSGGVWRIWFPSRDQAEVARAKQRGQKSRQQEMVERTKGRKEVLAHFDTYKSVGALVEALNRTRQEQNEQPTQLERRADERFKELERARASHPPATTREARERDIGESFVRIEIALTKRNAEEAAKYFYAQGDGGDGYVLARERRVLAAMQLQEAASKEIGSSDIDTKFRLFNEADDLYGLAMKMEEQEDRAAAKKQGEVEEWTPQVRLVKGVWKIDVTPETGGNAEGEAKRAEREAKAMNEIAKQVKEGKIQTSAALLKAMQDAGIRGNAKLTK